jgi:hypothetical protein
VAEAAEAVEAAEAGEAAEAAEAAGSGGEAAAAVCRGELAASARLVDPETLARDLEDGALATGEYALQCGPELSRR